MSDLVPVGDAAWRFVLPDGCDPASVLQTLRQWPKVIDAVVADRFALVRFEPGFPPDDPRHALTQLAPMPEAARRLHMIGVRYDGPDLDEVASRAGLTRDAVIERHAGREYAVELIGFLPGFGYLGPVAPELNVPRRSTPRLKVPAGSVGLAAGRTAVYPFESPGGWSLIGTAPGFRAFSPETGSSLRLGDRVRFEPLR